MLLANLDEVIRTAFDRSATISERAREFVDHRLRLVASHKTWKPFRPGPIAVAVWVPIASLSGRVSVDIAALNNHFSQLAFSDWSSVSRSMNLDGLVVYPGAPEPKVAFTQVFRSGAMETLRTAAALRSDDKLIPSGAITKYFREAVWKFAQQSRRLDLAGSCVVKCALMHTDGYQFLAGAAADRSRSEADRSHVALPESRIEAIEELKSIEQVDDIVRPMMDVLWQAFDLERCFDYALDGTWSPDH